MYTLRAILLSKQIIRDNQIRVVLFTEEFGKITAWAKKNHDSAADIGALIEILIERKGQENLIHKIQSLSIPKNDSWDYETTIGFLHFIHIMRESLPEGMEQRGIFHDAKEILEYLSMNDFIEINNKNQLVQLFILMKARIMKKQGYLREDLFSGKPELPVIYERLDRASMKSMIGAKNIHEYNLSKIELAIQEGFHSLKHRI